MVVHIQLLMITHHSQLRSVTCHIRDHTPLSATAEFTHARRTGTPFIYPGGIEDWVVLAGWFTSKRFTCERRVTHGGSNQLWVAQPGAERNLHDVL